MESTRCPVSVHWVIEVSNRAVCTAPDGSRTFRSMFSSVFANEDTSIIPDTQTNYMVAQNHLELEELVIEEGMVRDKLLKLRSDKAMGADDISLRLLVEIRKEICHPLTIIFNIIT